MLIEIISYTLIGIFVIPFIVGTCCIEGHHNERHHERGHHRGYHHHHERHHHGH